MNYICEDNRFEIIERYKNELISATNIESSPEEMAVLDNILFRFWQMGWLKEQEATMVIESENMYTGLPITHCPKCGISLDRYLYGRQYEGQINYCPMCGQAVKWE